MSKADRQRALRALVCDGCEQLCRYADFRAFGPRAGSFVQRAERDYRREYQRSRARKAAAKEGRLLKHGNSGRRHLGQLLFSEVSSSTKRETDEVEHWRHRSKGVVLGSMHATKMELWLEYTSKCPMNEKS